MMSDGNHIDYTRTPDDFHPKVGSDFTEGEVKYWFDRYVAFSKESTRAMAKVILDCESRAAFLENAETNRYSIREFLQSLQAMQAFDRLQFLRMLAGGYAAARKEMPDDLSSRVREAAIKGAIQQ